MQTAPISPLAPSAHADERRNHHRYAIDGTRVAFSARGSETEMLVAQVLDLSRDGILVKVPKQHIDRWPALRATISPLTLKLDGGHTLDLEAEVVWLGGQQTGGVREYRSGLCFTQLSPADERTLAAYLETLASC